MISELLRPNSEVEKLVDMPPRGTLMFSLSAENMATASVPTLREPMISVTERMVTSKPQKVPNNPRKMARPIR